MKRCRCCKSRLRPRSSVSCWKNCFARRPRRAESLRPVSRCRCAIPLPAAARVVQFVFFLLASAFIVGVAQHHSPCIVQGGYFFCTETGPRSPYDPADDANQQKDDDELHRAPLLTLRSDESITSTIAKFTVPYVMVG